MFISYPDPEIRHELYWKRMEICSPTDLGDLAYRPVGLTVEGERAFEIGIEGIGTRAGIIVTLEEQGIGILLGFRAFPLKAGNVGRITFAGYSPYNLVVCI